MKKGRVIVALILNVLILGVIGFALVNRVVGFMPNSETVAFAEMVKSYINDASIILFVAALLSLIGDITILAGKKPNKFVNVFKLIGVTGGLVITAGVLAYCIPFGYGGWTFNFVTDYYYGLLLVLVAPVLGLISAILEGQPKLKWPYAFFGLIVPGVYAIANYVFAMVRIQGFEWYDTYHLFQWQDMTGVWISVAVLGSFAVGSFLIAYCIVMLRRIGKKQEEVPAVEPVAEPTPVVEEAKPEEPAPAEEPQPAEPTPVVEEAKPEEPAPTEEPKPEEPKAEEPKPAQAQPQPSKKVLVRRRRSAPVAPRRTVPTGRPGPRVYHVAKHPSGQWSIKLASSDKVIKLFDTQAEAIAYAKGLVESRGGSVRIHSVSGRLRKE